MELIPEDATRMECLVVHTVLQRIKQRALAGEPSGKLIDQALEEALGTATSYGSE